MSCVTSVNNTATDPTKPPPKLQNGGLENLFECTFYPKNEAKALGARWKVESGVVESPRSKASSSNATSLSKTSVGVRTHASIKYFVAYNGDARPWD